MATAAQPPGPVRAVVELVRDDQVVALGAVTCPRRGDLELLDDLLRLHLIVGRLGWRVKLADPNEPLREMVDFLGISSELDVS